MQDKNMSDTSRYFSTPQIPIELIREGYAEPDTAPRYRSIYNAILDGRIPAEQVNGRYRIPRSTLPHIAALFGLKDQTSSNK
jgi:hypothetical protein